MPQEEIKITEEKEQPEKSKKIKQVGGKDFFTDLLESFVIAISISLFVGFTLVVPNKVEGQSMQPNFHDSELLLTNKVSQWLGSSDFGKQIGLDYQRGDVVIFEEYGIDYIKRVIAVGGDIIRINEGNVYVNGKEINEKYLPEDTLTYCYTGEVAFLEDDQVKRVPEGHYFLLGDNRANSKDSRFVDVGFVPREHLLGKVFFRYWPLDQFTAVTTGEFEELNTSTSD